AMGQTGPEMKPILEVNGDHPILAKVRDSSDEAFIADAAEVLLDQALLIAGVDLKEPALFVKALNNLLSK
ncbi:MAG: molecular chaperone HtpG, partial [Spirochaetia bacterium]|nr:molecular chaperone HtpG [Spirochaetia bacterium]